jgi:hypothetical protein
MKFSDSSWRILLTLIVGIALIYTGAYNVAADKDHTHIAKWISQHGNEELGESPCGCGGAAGGLR